MKRKPKVESQRAGMDHLSGFLVGIAAILWILGSYTWRPLIAGGWIVLLTAYLRGLSKNKIRRHQENIKFLKYWYPLQSKAVNQFRKIQAKREYRYFKCRECRQKLRVPRRIKRVQVTCPKCKNTFLKTTFRGRLQKRP